MIESIAAIYKEYFPNDKVVVGDAHQYLLEHYKEFDFIWSSPPCPTHSRARFWGWADKRPVYPDMKLYQEVIFLRHHFKGKWVVENVKPYYSPLIPAVNIGRHLFWSNFKIGSFEHKSSDIRELSGTSFKDKLERNKVDSEIGLYILNCARNVITKQNVNQLSLLDED
jgi:DNA (cytosine-5)-methyltransferase 1